MNATATQNLITNAIAEFGTTALTILGALIGISVALLIFKWGIQKLETSVLGYLHSAKGTQRFRTLGTKGQQAWSYVDRTLSRRQIMRMDM